MTDLPCLYLVLSGVAIGIKGQPRSQMASSHEYGHQLKPQLQT